MGNYLDSLEDIKKYLPKFLSPASDAQLYEGIDQFVSNGSFSSLYWSTLEPRLFQGDGLRGLLFSNFPSLEIKTALGMVVSNTCDVSLENTRQIPPPMCYALTVKLNSYIHLLKSHMPPEEKREEKIESHLRAIKTQRITNIFFLPKEDQLEEDCLVFFDRISHCDAKSVPDIADKRFFSLNNFGFYLFLVKLSIHFTRVKDGVDRTGFA